MLLSIKIQIHCLLVKQKIKSHDYFLFRNRNITFGSCVFVLINFDNLLFYVKSIDFGIDIVALYLLGTRSMPNFAVKQLLYGHESQWCKSVRWAGIVQVCNHNSRWISWFQMSDLDYGINPEQRCKISTDTRLQRKFDL